MSDFLCKSEFFKQQAPMFRELNIDHLLFGVLHYGEGAQDEHVITFGEELGDKFYQLLEGEVAVWVPEPILFTGPLALVPENLAYYLI